MSVTQASMPEISRDRGFCEGRDLRRRTRIRVGSVDELDVHETQAIFQKPLETDRAATLWWCANCELLVYEVASPAILHHSAHRDKVDDSRRGKEAVPEANVKRLTLPTNERDTVTPAMSLKGAVIGCPHTGRLGGVERPEVGTVHYKVRGGSGVKER
jgi:hypothetical protein